MTISFTVHLSLISWREATVIDFPSCTIPRAFPSCFLPLWPDPPLPQKNIYMKPTEVRGNSRANSRVKEKPNMINTRKRLLSFFAFFNVTSTFVMTVCYANFQVTQEKT